MEGREAGPIGGDQVQGKGSIPGRGLGLLLGRAEAFGTF